MVSFSAGGKKDSFCACFPGSTYRSNSATLCTVALTNARRDKSMYRDENLATAYSGRGDGNVWTSARGAVLRLGEITRARLEKQSTESGRGGGTKRKRSRRVDSRAREQRYGIQSLEGPRSTDEDCGIPSRVFWEGFGAVGAKYVRVALPTVSPPNAHVVEVF